MLPRPSSLRLAGLCFAAGLVGYAGCSSSGDSSIPVTHPTMIRVEPEDFLGDVPCDLRGPGLKRYVATIVDRNYGEGGAPGSGELGEGGALAPEGGADGFRAPSSLPTPCTTGTGFGFVVPGRHYEVFLDGYDSDAIAPRAPGAPEMVPTDVETDAAHTLVLKPRWRAKCVRAVAVDSTLVRADECRPFQLEDADASGELRVPLSALLGGLSCGTGEGEVDHFEVTPTTAGGVAGTTRTVPCSDSAAALLSGAAGERLSVYVGAFSAGSTEGGLPSKVVAGAQCQGVVRAGASSDATCAVLSQLGTVQVDVAAALRQLGGKCNATDIETVIVEGNGEVRRLPPPDCSQPVSFGFPPGPATLKLTATFVAAPASRTLTCTAEVLPGQIISAQCELPPGE